GGSDGQGGFVRNPSAWLWIILVAAPSYSYAQWAIYRDPTIPRTKDGKPNLSAPAPRVNGKPDLSGVWQAERTPMSEFARAFGPNLEKVQVDLNDLTKHALNVFWGLKPEEEPLRPEAIAILKQRSGVDSP